MATLVASQSSNSKIKSIIDNMFKTNYGSRVKTNEPEIELVRAQNKALDAQIKQLFEDEKFKQAVLIEAASGRIKFGESSPACADHVLVWDDVGASKKCILLKNILNIYHQKCIQRLI